MARKPKKPQQQPEGAKSFDEFVEDNEAGEEDIAVDDNGQSQAKMRDWRDVEKFKEERQLRRLIGDDLDLGDLDSSRAGGAKGR